MTENAWRNDMPITIGIDIGGTFTDVVAFDASDGRLWVTKVPSTPENHAIGFKNGLEKIVKMTASRFEDIAELAVF